MPMKGTPVCLKCEATESPLWTNAENLGAICLACVNEAKNDVKKEEDDDDDKSEDSRSSRRKTRQTRSYKTRQNSTFAVPNKSAPKGRGRRVIFKRQPMKASEGVATPVTSDSVFYKGTYIQIGDIVSVRSEEGDIYYAQIKGLLTDQYCEKSAVLTWLLPTRESPPPEEAFEPATYIIGPEEDMPRDLDCMEFIMHAPSDYYKTKNTPYPSVQAPARPGYIWTSLDSIKNMHGFAERVEVNGIECS